MYISICIDKVTAYIPFHTFHRSWEATWAAIVGPRCFRRPLGLHFYKGIARLGAVARFYGDHGENGAVEWFADGHTYIFTVVYN